ncbi:MAG: thioredoxin domain-containing protein [Candidatus Moraniibacteriota bacterium]
MAKENEKAGEEESTDWEETETESEEKPEKTKTPSASSGRDKTVQNYIAAIILLAGLLAGSIFVDVADLVKGQGISQKLLAGKDIFVDPSGRTWVASNDPLVELTIVNDESCAECKTDSAILGLKSAIPTVVPTTISSASEEGKKLIAKTGSKVIPVFIFGKSVEKTEVFPKIENLLTAKDDIYTLDTSVLGITGKYTEVPPFESKNQTILGNPDAKVSIIEFSDFQCPYCKLFYDALDQLAKDPAYKDKLKVSFKNLPLSFHAKSNDAAMASECAGEQGKFWEMYGALFTKQADWQNATNNDKFKSYAAGLKLDTAKFNQCLDTNKLQGDIDADKELAKNFGISGTPAIFINDQFVSGAIKIEDLKARVDELLAK